MEYLLCSLTEDPRRLALHRLGVEEHDLPASGPGTIGQDLAVSQEAATGVGVTSETPTVSGFGAPSDPITVRLTNTHASNTPDVTVQVNVENA